MYKAYRMSHFSLYLMENKFYENQNENPQIENFVIKDPVTNEEIKFTEKEVNKNSENGLYQRILAGNTVAMFYNLWEDKYRKLIAEKINIDRNDLKNDFFGDLRYIRQSITHNNYNAISDLKKLKKLNFVYENNFLKLTSIEIEKIYNELKLETKSLQNLYGS